MYTKQDLIENKKMDEIIKQNQIKMRKLFIKNKKEEIKANVFLLVSGTFFFIGLLYLLSVVERINF